MITNIVGGIIQGNAARDAANIQADSAREASKLQKQIFDQQRKDATPWREAGMRALTGLENADFQRDFTMNDFQADPGYAFRMGEGMKALERSAAARGGLMAGGTMKALTRYGQDFASNEFQNAYNRFNSDRDRRFNRLSSLAGLGQTANTQVGQAGQNYANQVGSNMMQAGNASAAGRMGVANAYTGAMNNMQDSWMSMLMAGR